MRFLRSYFTFILMVFAFALVATASAQNFSASGSTRAIEDQVRKKILKLPRYEVFDSINFRVNGDTVTLSGKVRNAVNRRDAESSVRRVPGVSRVVNNIEILPVGGFDERIRAQLYNTLSASGGLSRYLWTVN